MNFASKHVIKSLQSTTLRCRSGFPSNILSSTALAYPSTRLYSSTSPPGEETIVARCKRLLEEKLSPSYLKIKGSNDDPNGSHIMIECVSSQFEGKNRVQRQRLIYQAIWDEMQSGRVHAVDGIVAKSPSEASS